MITKYISKREISSKKRRCSVRFVGSPSTAHETSLFAPPWRVSMPCAVGFVFADGLVAFHAVQQQSRRYEFHHHHLGERAIVHLAYGDKSTRSHNRRYQSFRYCPHNPVFFLVVDCCRGWYRTTDLGGYPALRVLTLLNYTASVLNKIYAKTLD